MRGESAAVSLRGLARSFLRGYRELFSIEEIERSMALKWVFGATILSYFTVFNQWLLQRATTLDAVTDQSFVCWPYFQNCDFLYVLRTLPEGHSQPLLYMTLFGSFLLAAYFMYRGRWVLAHLSLVPAFLWHFFILFFLTYLLGGNYEYYLAILAATLLFFPHKEFFLKLYIVLFYVLSTATKIHEGWVLGTYFSALKTGLPLFPDWSIPLWTNLVIGMELVGSWFLLSKRTVLQRSALVFFAAFHLYSGLLVSFRYPSTILPTLLILFGPLYRHTPIPFDRKAIVGWALVPLLFSAQFLSNIIPGDEKLTLEGNRYGLYMFEANHQCISAATVHFVNGLSTTRTEANSLARNRCDPYQHWFKLQSKCAASERVERISWVFDHSVNGGPFLRIVDVADVCALDYKPFSRNEWIRTEKDNPPIVGYPVENIYR